MSTLDFTEYNMGLGLLDQGSHSENTKHGFWFASECSVYAKCVLSILFFYEIPVELLDIHLIYFAQK